MAIPVCTVTGNVLSLLNSPVQNCTVVVSVSTPFFHSLTGSWISGQIASVQTDPSGSFSVGVIETETENSTVQFEFQYFDGSANRKFKRYAVVIPNQASAALSDLVTQISNVPITITFPASGVTLQPISGLSSLDVQDAIAELVGEIALAAPESELLAHTTADSGVHGVMGNVVGTTDAQTLTTKTIPVSNNYIVGNADTIPQFNVSNGNLESSTVTIAQLNAVTNAITDLTGDVTADGPGSVAATVALVGGSSAANVHTAELLANAATNANTVSTIVKRDGSGNFTAGTITAALSGNATTATSFTGNLAGDVTGPQGTTVVALVGGSTAANVHAAELLANAAVSTNTVSTIVKRDGSGNFSAGTITAALSGNATTATTATNSTNFTGSLSGNVTGTQGATVVATVGGSTAANVHAAELLANAAVSTATASTIVKRDSNANAALNNWLSNVTTTATSAGTTNLTAASARMQRFTGTTTQTVNLPVNTGSSVGLSFAILNRSTGIITVLFQDGTVCSLVNAGTQTTFTCADVSIANGVWDVASSASGSTGSAGAKNYVSHGDFENNSINGWSLFTTTLTGVIPTGSITAGASSLATPTVTSTNPLAGTYSLAAGGASAWTAGQGIISPAMTIDAEDQSRILNFKFYYKVTSGTFNMSGSSSNSLAIYFWDTANSAWVQPSGVYSFIQSGGIGFASGTFQTAANATSYQMAILGINSISGANTLELDDFFLGPSSTVLGFSASDFQSFPVTITAVTTNPTQNAGAVVSAMYARSGDSAEINYNYAQSSSGTAGSGVYLFNLPPGLSVDTTKVTLLTAANVNGAGATNLGEASFANTTGSSVTSETGYMVAYDATHLAMVLQSAATARVLVSSAAATLSGAAYYTFKVRVPISGWSSNTSQSVDTDTRVVAMRAHASTGSSMGSLIGSFSTIIYDTVDQDTHGGYNAATGAYTIQVTGDYDIAGSFQLFGTGALNTTEAIQVFNVNNSNVIAQQSYVYGGAVSVPIIVPVSINSVFLTAGTQIVLQAASNGTFSGSFNSNTAANFFSISRRSGPATIQATESVMMKYTNTAGTSIANTGDNNVPFATKVYDTHNAWTGTQFRVPVSGKYTIKGTNNYTSSTYASGNLVVASVYKNSAIESYGPVSDLQAALTLVAGASVATDVQCVAGDLLEIRAQNTRTAGATTLNTSAGFNHIEIFRSGN